METDKNNTEVIQYTITHSTREEEQPAVFLHVTVTPKEIQNSCSFYQIPSDNELKKCGCIGLEEQNSNQKNITGFVLNILLVAKDVPT